MSTVLQSIRVIDLAQGQALIAGNMLARLGADVIVVEPPEGSPTRRLRLFEGSAGTEGVQNSALWSALATGRRGVTCDLTTNAGQSMFDALLADADVLITGGKRTEDPVAAVDWMAKIQAFPRLIHLSLSPFGNDGPKCGQAATDLTIWAASGPLWSSRDGNRPPLRISSDQAFLHAGADGAVGVLVALIARAKNGRGQRVSVSAQESVAQATLSAVLAASVGHESFSLVSAAPSPKLGEKKQLDLSGSGSRTRRSKWNAADGIVELHLAMGPTGGRFTNNLFAWLNSLNAYDAQFTQWDWAHGLPAQIEAGEVTDDDLEVARGAVADTLIRFTKTELLDIAMRHKLLLAPIMTIADLTRSDHLAARHAFVEVVEADGQRRRVPASVTGQSGIQIALRPAPAIGEHNTELHANKGDKMPAGDDLGDRRNAVGDVRPLAGLKVVDLAWVVAGPMVGRVLADCGAEVVRLESSERIETARMMGPFPGGKRDPQRSGLFDNCNAGKLGITVDLSSPAGREIVLDLVKWGDILIESFAPGQMAKWELSYDMLKKHNPGLIMVSTSLMGQSGPLSTLAGFGNLGAALSGFQSIVGYPDCDMIGPFGPYTDYVGPRFATAALLAAVIERRETGKGRYLDVSQVEAGLQFLAPEFCEYFETGHVASAQGNRVTDMAPHGVFRCAGRDRWVAIAVRSDSEWQKLTRLLGDKASDPAFVSLAGRKAHEDDVEALLGCWTDDQAPQDVEDQLQAIGIPAHVVADSADMAADPQLVHCGHFIRLPHELGGDSVVEASRFRLSDTPVFPAHAAPILGRDTDYVLREKLGYGKARIASLHERHILK